MCNTQQALLKLLNIFPFSLISGPISISICLIRVMTRFYNKMQWSEENSALSFSLTPSPHPPFSFSLKSHNVNNPGQQGSSPPLLFRNPGSLLLCIDIICIIKSDGCQMVGREKRVCGRRHSSVPEDPGS